MTYGWLGLAGVVAGLLARAVLPGARRLGIVLTAVLGVAGALLAAWAGAALGAYLPGEPATLAAAVAGAALLVFAGGRLLG